jgi:glycosyltransferase involved in cell wall biosynthesis
VGTTAFRVGLYSPYFGAVYGGGEKYLGLAALAIKAARPEADVELSGSVPVDPGRFREMFGVDLAGLVLKSGTRRVTPAHRLANQVRALRPLRDRVLRAQAARISRGYDLFIPMVYEVPVVNSARRGLLLVQFPGSSPRAGVLDGYEAIVCQSEYVREWVRRRWDRDAVVVYPPVDAPARAIPPKDQVILSVGRFFASGHTKRQDFLVEAFRRLCDEGLSGWELHLAGSVHRAAEHAGYYERIRELARGYPIDFHPDASHAEVEALYGRAAIYWHASGYGAGADRPEAFEHFGMTTAEAMANGAVPAVYAGGGQLEIVEDGVNGRFWTDLEGLLATTRDLMANSAIRERLAAAARSSVERFSRERFAAGIQAAAAPLLA